MSESSQNRQAPTVVIVNDDVTQLTILTELLKKDGMNVLSFQGAEDAIKGMASAPQPKLIVTDLHMPDIDGWRFCRLLRSPEYAVYNHTPILVVSATFSGDDPRALTSELGANAFLQAPVAGPEFLRQVHMLLAGQTPQQRTKILAIDDNEPLTRILKKCFEAHGYEADVAFTCAEGLALFREHRHDVVIVDYHLPDARGDSILEQIRRISSRTVPIMVTADPNPDLAVEWLRKGACAYVRKPFDVQYVIALCEHARRERALLHVEDLLEQRTEELRRSEEFFRAITENSSDATVIVNADGQLKYASPSIRRITGYTTDEVLATTPETFIHPADMQVVRGAVESALDEPGKPVRLDSFRVQRRDRHDLCLEGILVGMPDVPSVRGVVINCRDVTERQRAQNERERLIEELEAKNAELESFTYTVSHDLKGPLNTISSFVGLIESSLADGDERLQGYVTQLHGAANKMEQLLNDLLELSRAGRIAGSPEPVSFRNLVDHTLTTLAGAIAERNVQVEIDDDLPWVVGDPIRLLGVVQNLIENAVKYLGDQPEPKVCIGVRQEHDGEQYLFVSDNGIGIDPQQQQRVFDLFFQLDTRSGGSGLGLALVRRVVESNGGRIWVESEGLGKGTTFCFTFPTQPMPAHD